MARFESHRLSKGNLVFTDIIEIDGGFLHYERMYLVGRKSVTIPMSSITSVYLNLGILFTDVVIETAGGRKVVASGFTKCDAKEIRQILTGR